MFVKKAAKKNISSGRISDFDYIKENDIYMDSSCQTMRPKVIIDSITDYYQSNNACGGRVKYRWGQKVDAEIEQTRELVINYLGLPIKNYICSFTLNTTYGLNLILGQLSAGVYSKVITSEIEHNSVFLTTIETARRLGVERIVLDRLPDGSLKYDKNQLEKSILVVNAVSNIDGRRLENIKEVISDTHKAGGIVIIDAAQAMVHDIDLIRNLDADAICFSGHKMYSASLGAIVIKKTLLQSLNLTKVGGGMVTAVRENEYDLTTEDLSSWLEPGLQSYAEIIALKNAINWLTKVKINGRDPKKHLEYIAEKLYEGLNKINGLHLINTKSSPVLSFYCNKIDAHRLAVFLSASGIMVRSGYFCCHYYLIEKMHLPPLVRMSIGLHTTEADIDRVIEQLSKLVKG